MSDKLKKPRRCSPARSAAGRGLAQFPLRRFGRPPVGLYGAPGAPRTDATTSRMAVLEITAPASLMINEPWS